MKRWREILEKLLELAGKLHTQPLAKDEEEKVVRIGPDNIGLLCPDKGVSYRLSGSKGDRFPAAAIQKELGCSEAELLAALRWVTQEQSDQFGESEFMFWAFIPKNKQDWPKE